MKKADMILYTSNTGYTRQYAMLLAEKTGLAVYTPEEAGDRLTKESRVIYMGWLMAGKVQGYEKTARRCRVEAVCAVGMGATGSQLEDVRKGNALPETLPVFTLQGGFDLSRLMGIYRLMMTVMAKTLGKKLAEKEDPTPEEKDMLDLLLNGGSRVSERNLQAVLDWYREE